MCCLRELEIVICPLEGGNRGFVFNSRKRQFSEEKVFEEIYLAEAS